MPVISIKSLPLNKITDIPALLKKLNKDVADSIGYKHEHIWSYWQFIDSNYYAVGGNLSETIQKETHSPIVEVLSFEGKSEEHIETMLSTTARLIAEGLDIDIGNVFVTYHKIKSGQVFDGGQVVKLK